MTDIIKEEYPRQEFQTVQSDVETRLEQGYSRTLIYEELLQDGRITMTYPSFCEYVRGGRKKNGTPAKRDASELLSEIMDSIEPRTETGLNLKAVHRKLEESGITGLSYADFCDYFRAAGGYTWREIPDNFVFFDEDGLITFYYRMASFLEAEADTAAPQKLQ